jgi:GDP-4-dehydro-6-deoxy-D-mannose reductase
VRVLVTGAGGFVGHHLLAHLGERGDDVVPLDPQVDVTDAAVLSEAVVSARAEGIVHLAAQASVPASWADPPRTWSVNAIGTVHLLQAALSADPRPRVLLVSTAEVYGRVLAGHLPIGEDQPMAPVSTYAAAKAAAELAGLQAFLGYGLEVVRARPFNHTGAGQRTEFVVPALAEQVARASRSGATCLETGNLHVKRDISDVRDVVRAYRLLLEKGEPGEVYNVCSGEAVSIEEVAHTLMRLAGLDLPLTVDPARARSADLPELRGDPSRLQRATRWAPEIPLEVTLAEVLAYWQQKEAGLPQGPPTPSAGGQRVALSEPVANQK